MRDEDWATFWLIIAIFFVALAWYFIASIKPAHSRDFGQWDRSSETSKWFQSLMQPDNPAVSCCGEADAYWCDIIHVRDQKTFCTITDDRDDEPLRRKHFDVGTEIEIPNHKLTFKDGNPTGHSVVFLSRGLYVFCFVLNGGV